ncbi:hypothetical protein D9598_09275 [Roseomonas sp. KE0001]|nr:hypothetical protein [Roseomonas sp. KE0001]
MASIIPNGFRLLRLRGGQILTFDRPDLLEMDRRLLNGPKKNAKPEQILEFLAPHMEKHAKAGLPVKEADALKATEEWIERSFDGRLIVRQRPWRVAWGKIDKAHIVPVGGLPTKAVKTDKSE